MRGVAAALLPSVAGAGTPVFEAGGEAGYCIGAATAVQVEALRGKLQVLGGELMLALKQLDD